MNHDVSIASIQTIISRLRLRQLQLLIALEDHGTLHRAAEQLAISQPGATKVLNELESLFGARLFTRTGQGLVPNELGLCVTRYARLVHNNLVHMRDELAGIMEGNGGHLAIGSITAALPYISQTVARLLESQPELSIAITEGSSAQLLGELDRGGLDLVFCRTSVSAQPEQYVCLRRYSEEMALIVNPAHPLAQQSGPLDLRHIGSYRWVVFPSGMPMRTALERAFAKEDLDFPRHLVETSSGVAQLFLVHENSDVIAQVPARIARFGAKMRMSVKLPLAIDARSLSYDLVRRKVVEPTPAMALFLKQLDAIAPDLKVPPPLPDVVRVA